jgi:hypothetical protein
MQKFTLSFFLVLMTIFSLNTIYINDSRADLPPSTPLFICENIHVQSFEAPGYYKIQWEVDCYGYCNDPTQVGLDKFWSIIPWENCTNNSENTVFTLFLKADRYRSCTWNSSIPPHGDWNAWGDWTDTWEVAPILSSPNASYWIKIWNSRQECAGDNCGSQWSLDLKQGHNGMFGNDIDYYLYYCSFVMNRDQFFCYEPLLNEDANELSAAWVGSEWCGYPESGNLYGWHPVDNYCDEGGFQP